MAKETFGSMIAALRKERNMTQAQLAEKMGVTDKAVSKWERDISYPDVAALPKLAEVFGITVDELMRVRSQEKAKGGDDNLVKTVCSSVALAMGVAAVVLRNMGLIEVGGAVADMLGIGLACAGIALLNCK